MVSLLRQGQNGSQILDILDAITLDYQEVQAAAEDNSAEWALYHCASCEAGTVALDLHSIEC